MRLYEVKTFDIIVSSFFDDELELVKVGFYYDRYWCGIFNDDFFPHRIFY